MGEGTYPSLKSAVVLFNIPYHKLLNRRRGAQPLACNRNDNKRYTDKEEETVV